jgi:hypothetical protein
MSDRKYKQRGYQDETRERQQRERPKPPPKEHVPGGRPLQDASGPRTPNLMAAHEVFRCARCGNLLSLSVGVLDACSKCQADLHSCIQCVSFDTSSRWECEQAAQLTARVSPKDERNTCTFFAPRTTVERQTSTPPSSNAGASAPSAASPSAAPSTNSARKAFDDLFK